MTKRHKRMALVTFLVVGVGCATALAITAFNKNMMYFFSPSEVAEGKVPVGQMFRVGGLVTTGSVKREKESLTVNFIVTDTVHNVPIQYTGSLPALFREGQGIIARGKLQSDGSVLAEEILAKHDENYMPPEVADSLKAAHDKGVEAIKGSNL